MEDGGEVLEWTLLQDTVDWSASECFDQKGLHQVNGQQELELCFEEVRVGLALLYPRECSAVAQDVE